MISSKTNSSKLDLKSSDWEIDFYSRPILEKNGKKRWELIISSTKSFESPEIFYWNKICPADKVNSLWLTSALKEAIIDAEVKGWRKPEKVRFWRSSMKSIIKKSLETLELEALISRRTYTLFERLNYLENDIYPKDKGFVKGVLAPNFTAQIANEPQPLPEAVRGESLTFSEISIRDLRTAQSWPIEFGDIFPVEECINDDHLIPGLRLFSKDRAVALAAWFSSLEPVKLIIDKDRLILEALENDKWLVTDLPSNEAQELNQKFISSKSNSFGYQFISIQSTPYIEKFEGFWMLKDIDLVN